MHEYLRDMLISKYEECKFCKTRSQFTCVKCGFVGAVTILKGMRNVALLYTINSAIHMLLYAKKLYAKS